MLVYGSGIIDCLNSVINWSVIFRYFWWWGWKKVIFKIRNFSSLSFFISFTTLSISCLNRILTAFLWHLSPRSCEIQAHDRVSDVNSLNPFQEHVHSVSARSQLRRNLLVPSRWKRDLVSAVDVVYAFTRKDKRLIVERYGKELHINTYRKFLGIQKRDTARREMRKLK